MAKSRKSKARGAAISANSTHPSGGSIGSNAAPTGDGNIQSPVGARKPRDSSKFRWVATIPYECQTSGSILPHHVLEKWFHENCTRAIWQLERAESGYIHWQCSFSLKKKQRISWLKSHCHPTAFFDGMNNQTAAFNYCDKAETRIDGPFYHPQPIRLMADPLKGLTLKPWQLDILDIVSKPADRRTIHWYWDNIGNVGKTTFAEHLKVTRSGVRYVSGSSKDIKTAVRPTDTIVIWNIVRSVENYVSYKAIEEIKDGLFFKEKYESDDVVMHAKPHVIIFANFPPRTDALSADRWHIVQINE